MVVYIVVHGDEQPEIRGVFATRRLAEQVITLDETGVYPATERRGERFWRRDHDESCCSVDEATVETILPTPFVLNPEEPWPAESFVPKAWAFDALEGLRAHPTTRR